MTAIKKLVMKGFKSFAKRTELDFNNNFSVVLGPNGSGKSNVTDAICFALGTSSAKTMRAESSAKLIYHGGEKGNSAKEAEVSIVFANNNKEFPIEMEEFIVTRILKHSGQSVYKLNNKTVTRQQILDLLANGRINPDGHNIILQGEITHFAEMKPVDRRQIIEEIAGISVYEDKKGKAMLELDKVEAKLNEAEIILGERQKTLSEMKTDRDAAIQFREKEETLNRNKATKLSLTIKDREEKKAESEAKQTAVNKETEGIRAAIQQMKDEVLSKQKESEEIMRQVNEQSGVKQKEILKSIEDNKTLLAKKNARKEVCETEAGKLASRNKSLEKEIKETEEKIKGKDKEKQLAQNRTGIFEEDEKKIDEKIKQWKKKHGLLDLENFNKRASEIDAELEGHDKKIFGINQRKTDALRKKDVTALEISNADSKIKEIEGTMQRDKEKFSQLKGKREEFRGIAKQLSSALNESSVFASQLQDARKEEEEYIGKLAQLRAKDMGIKDLNAGDMALQKLKEMKIDGVIGTVSELGIVSSKYALALEVAAGPRLKSLVVNNDATAAKCIRTLKEQRLGVVTFLPMNKIQERAIDPESEKLAKENGVVGFATSLVSFEPKYKNIFKYVFGPTLVVDSIETARKLGIGRARMVSIEGDLCEQTGAMSGGYRRKTGIGFKEKELDAELSAADAELGKVRQLVELLESKRTSNEEAISTLREKKAALEAELNISGNADDIETGMQELLEKKKKFAGDLADVEKELGEIEKELKAATEIADKIKAERLEIRESSSKAEKANMSELDAMEEELKQAKEGKMRVGAGITAIDLQASMFTEEIGKIKSIIAENEKAKEDFRNEFIRLGDEIKQGNEQLKELEKTQAKMSAEFAQMFKKKEKLKDQCVDIEGRIIRQEEKLGHIEEKHGEFGAKIAELDGELVQLRLEFEAFANVQLRRGMALEQLNAEIAAIEREMKSMGNINMRALEIYEKANEECLALIEKKEKLKLEKEDVLNMMHSIEEKKKDSFMAVYDKLTGNFKTIFSSLSAKGEVNLVIQNPEDPFQAGVDITVRVGSNKFVDIIGFSGGEKTLAALAFLFAIQEFEPAPFYIMDEVDAALDKTNSDLLSKLLSKYSDKSQYIVISHNDGIISAANSVYGVSLPKDGYGMSKVVSLKI